jgi:hypothetical protein
MLQAFELLIIVAATGIIAAILGLAALLVIPAIFGNK